MSGIPPTTIGTVLEDIITQCVEDSEIWFPYKAADVPFLLLALTGELGEACNVAKKIERGDYQDDPEKYDKAVLHLREEITDVFIYLMNLIGVMRIDIVKEYNEKREANEKRFYS